MKRFPLVRIRLSNEYIMAILFGILILFQVPYWAENILSIFSFIGVLILALLLDLIITMKMEGTIRCGVSTAVTVGIIYAIFPSTPFWGSLLGVFIAVLLGKLAWGGMGKNILNPAMVGVVLMNLIFPTGDIIFVSEWVIVIAMVLTVPFILIRPYVSIGLMGGMILSMALNDSLSLTSVISSGMIFFGCVVVTDPVTSTHRPLVGGITGFILGIAAIFNTTYYSAGTMALLVLCFNVLTYILEHKSSVNCNKKSKPTKIRVPYRNDSQLLNNYNTEKRVPSKIDGFKLFTPEEIIKKIHDNEVHGLGGAGFPAHLKIKAAVNAKETPRTIIINAVECDPGLVHDKWILKQHSEEIEKGIQILRKCLPECKVILATKKGEDCNFRIKVDGVSVPNIYPIGAEKKLIKSVLGIELPLGSIPAECGILVFNVQTIFSIYEAVCLNKKAEFKFITIANLIKKEAYVSIVKLESRVSEVIDTIKNEDEIIFVGGGIMQCRQADEDERVDKTTNFIAVADMPRYKEGKCSKCGVCVKRCPSNLEVFRISNLVEKGQIEKTSIYNPEMCISCGICSYFCLAGKNLSRKVNIAKKSVSKEERIG